MYSKLNDGGAYIKPVFAYHIPDIIAGGSLDNKTYTSAAIDRDNFNSLTVAFGYSGTIQDTETIDAQIILQHCDTSGGSYTNLVTIVDTAVDVGLLTQDSQVLWFNQNLASAKRYLKLSTNIDLSADNSDALWSHVMAILSGATVLPVSESE